MKPDTAEIRRLPRAGDCAQHAVESKPDATASPGYRWLVLACAWSLFFGSYVDRLAWANLSAPAGKALNIPVPALGIFASAFSVGYVAGNALAGFAADRLGPR